MSPETLFLVGLFVATSGLVFGLTRIVVARRADDDDTLVRRRLNREGPPARGPALAGQGKAVSGLLTKISSAAASPMEPKSEEEQSALRRKLAYAGMYAPGALRVFVGAKLLLMVGGLVLGYLVTLLFGMTYPMFLLPPVVLGAIGMFSPELWLSAAVRREQLSLEHALPDALDLMVVCVEAGLTMDAALQRVSKELALAHPSLARELGITHVETQMGVPRADAMRKLANRTGSAALKSLTAMLIQADRFGTSIAGALRVYSDSLRVKRQFAAQEMAAKAAVKITFPLVFCIFPAIMTVAGGPAMIQISRALVGR
jgi:tight adherence protein C